MEHIILYMVALVLQIIHPVADVMKYLYSLIMSSFFLIKCQSVYNVYCPKCFV